MNDRSRGPVSVRIANAPLVVVATMLVGSMATAADPLPIMFAGAELGEPVITGPALAGTGAGNPVKRAYELMYDGIKGRPSWDPLTVLYAIRGLGDYWQAETGGQNVIDQDGSNSWQPPAGKNHAYLKARMPNAATAEILNCMMTGGPASK